ncbi:MAG: amidohydrolase family protein, partial [Chloroflexi bacterium]|nr:amidohydrolase family protein [Chloroflexota bacterium]
LTFEESVTAMTAAPAAAVGSSDLGALKMGAVADVAVLDPDREPTMVTIMNGEVVWHA